MVVDRHAEAAEKVAAEIGGRAMVADVADEQAVAAAVTEGMTLGPLRVVINCAGIGWADRVLRADGTVHPLAGFEKVVRVNLVGTFNVVRLAAAAMAETTIDDDGQRGIIVNTASVAALDGQTGQAAYAASKGGVVSMTLPLARDLSVVGIRVCTIVPGLMDTPLASTMAPATRSRLAATALLPKRFGRPDEYALLALSIVDNPYLNAEVIRLDAGMRMAVK